jgi:hypothetical protein
MCVRHKKVGNIIYNKLFETEKTEEIDQKLIK